MHYVRHSDCCSCGGWGLGKPSGLLHVCYDQHYARLHVHFAGVEAAAAAEKLRQEDAILEQAQQIFELRNTKQLPVFPEPKRPKVHWDHVLEEMQWMAKEFAKYGHLLLGDLLKELQLCLPAVTLPNNSSAVPFCVCSRLAIV